MFLQYLLRNNFSNKLYLLGFVVAVLSYSLWYEAEVLFNIKDENEGAIFYIGIALSFCCYTSAYMFSKWDKWRWFPMFAFFICLGRLTKEIYIVNYPYDVETHDLWDYINFLLTIFIVFNYYIKYQHKKFKEIK